MAVAVGTCHQPGQRQRRPHHPRAHLTLKSLTVSGGAISNMGGGALSDQGTLNLNDTTIKDNLATTGGGLYNNGGQLNLDRSTVERNTATGFGGGVANDFNGTMTMKGGTHPPGPASLHLTPGVRQARQPAACCLRLALSANFSSSSTRAIR
ncbi:hypothetical protein [Streptomyces rugosispiralis]|uniref:Uncharacterized protein n=1 Tax=Streptomyces rugosispiralis TaxID=2967341 RepID=A0ABT1V984_9ACTN|nr:hypothetical protein [Streptomyces rugosispiralis]MCQ8193081.1 hypothetical protein [Streptomyces rugosispiralis]